MASTHTPPPTPASALSEGDRLRALADEQERLVAESIRRSDDDGSLSQWAHDNRARQLRAEASLADADGIAEFPALFGLDGTLVNARPVETRYGTAWMLVDATGTATGEFVTYQPARESTLTKKGYREGVVTRHAKVVAHAGGWQYAPMTYTVEPIDWFGEPVAVLTTNRFSKEEAR